MGSREEKLSAARKKVCFKEISIACANVVPF